MKKSKLNQYETKSASEPSPEQIQQAKEWAVNRMMEVVDRLPANIQPVAESLQELARQAKFGIPREVTLTVSGDDKKPIQLPISLTLHNSGGEENSGKNKFTDLEMELLKQINGE